MLIFSELLAYYAKKRTFIGEITDHYAENDNIPQAQRREPVRRRIHERPFLTERLTSYLRINRTYLKTLTYYVEF